MKHPRTFAGLVAVMLLTSGCAPQTKAVPRAEWPPFHSVAIDISTALKRVETDFYFQQSLYDCLYAQLRQRFTITRFGVRVPTANGSTGVAKLELVLTRFTPAGLLTYYFAEMRITLRIGEREVLNTTVQKSGSQAQRGVLGALWATDSQLKMTAERLCHDVSGWILRE